jgi:hypothetical protein
MLQRYEGIDAEEILPAALPDVPVTFEPNKGYVREVLAATVDLRADGLGFTPESELPSGHRYRRFQEVANARGAPSDEVLQANVDAQGRDYRYETEGPSPVVDLREPLFVTTPLTGGRSHG